MYDEDERMIDGGQILPKYKVGEIVAIAQSYKDLGYDPDSLDRDPKAVGIRGFMKHSAGWNNKMFVSAAACRNISESPESSANAYRTYRKRTV